MRGRLRYLVPLVGVGFVVGSSVLVSGQVPEDKAKPAPKGVTVKKREAAPEPAQVKAEVRLAAPMVIQGNVNGVMIQGNVNLNVNGMVVQWNNQFRPILQVEYRFMRGICNPAKKERLLIAQAGLKALEEAAKAYVDWQNNQNRVVAGRLIERPANPDTRRFIQNALATSVKVQLSSEVYARYRAELDARSAEQKRVAILNLVAKLDRLLVLSTEQRDQMTASLSKSWQEDWAQSVQMLNVDYPYFPMIPDAVVSEHLNVDQKSIWNAIPKVTFQNAGNNFMFNGQQLNQPLDDEFSDEDALAAANTAPKADAQPQKPEPAQ